MRILLVCPSSVTRALLTSLLMEHEVHGAESLSRAFALGLAPPEVVIVDAAIPRASPDALDRLRAALGTPFGVVLVDRAFSDERRGVEEARVFGADAALAIPPERAALDGALRRAAEAQGPVPTESRRPAAQEIDQSPRPPADTEQTARYVERLWSKLDELDAYQLLRVPPTASDLEIKAAFRQRALEFHPDLPHRTLDEEGRERVYQIFKRVSWAFRKVGDPAARKQYDAAREAERS
jgi:DNA-binding NarL/FixJ family response regulator